jgi:hypothetical protein
MTNHLCPTWPSCRLAIRAWSPSLRSGLRFPPLPETSPPLAPPPRPNPCILVVSDRERHGLSLHSRPFLAAPSRKPLAGSDRAAGFRLPLPRLERAHHRGVLRAQHRSAYFGWRGAHREAPEQLFENQLQFRADGAFVVAEQGSGCVRSFARHRQRDARPAFGTWKRDFAGLQPHDLAARQHARCTHASGLGHSRFSNAIRPRTGRDVAAGRSGKPGVPGRARRERDRVYDSFSVFREPRARTEEQEVGRRERRENRSLARVSSGAAIREKHRGVFLRRFCIASGRL